jgi:hypothetical protein
MVAVTTAGHHAEEKTLPAWRTAATAATAAKRLGTFLRIAAGLIPCKALHTQQ